VFILLVFRIMGKRSLKDVTTFDFVLLIIVSETTNDALIGEDYSLTACFILVSTLVMTDFIISKIRERSKSFAIISEGAPLVIVEKGVPLKNRLKKSRVDEGDVMEAARLLHGLERMDQIKYAVLERDGSISIIPAASTQEDIASPQLN